MPAPHRIRRQLWRVRTTSPADAFALRRELRAAWETVLLPALEAAFDGAAGDDRVIRIPRLELRLRLEDPGALAVELPRLIHEAAVAQLALVKPGGPAQPWEIAVPPALSPGEDRVAALLHYLLAGVLPWAAAGASAAEASAVLRTTARAHAFWLVDRVMAAPHPRAFAFRLLQLVEEDDVPGWIAVLPARVPPLWRAVLLRLLAPAAAPEPFVGESGPASGALPPATPPTVAGTKWTVPARHARLEAAAALLVEALARPVADTPDAVAEAAVGVTRGGAGNGIAPLIASLPEIAVAREQAKRAGSPKRSTRGARAGSAASAPGAEPATRPVPASTTPEAPTAPAAEVAPQPIDADAEEFGLAIQNAGLILLLPFIAPLLEHRRIREGDTIPEHALPRAAALLHFLATGREEVLEWELALPKVLLGLTPEHPLPLAKGCLSEEDRDECSNLLASAVAHWTALGDSSPEAVRATFLQRPGLLRRDPQGWTLRVEHSPFDILLARLPWTISVARLPWMARPIYTEWTTTP
ncbi:MAG TPA: contractile injection system tape measure protein [Longimicrobium sp.]|nr:contractile injection system tape measure protein [Longimicrobium sp.]